MASSDWLRGLVEAATVQGAVLKLDEDAGGRLLGGREGEEEEDEEHEVAEGGGKRLSLLSVSREVDEPKGGLKPKPNNHFTLCTFCPNYFWKIQILSTERKDDPFNGYLINCLC